MFLKRGGTLGIVWLIVTGSLVLADSTNDGDQELEYFRSETDCQASKSSLTKDDEAELLNCIRANNDTVRCIEIKSAAKEKCLLTEALFNKAIDMEVENMKDAQVLSMSAHIRVRRGAWFPRGDQAGPTRRRRKEKTFHLKCPNGKSFKARGKKGLLNTMKESCEKHPPYCTYDINHKNLGCSSAVGPALESQYKIKQACVIHDLCYAQYADSDRKRCDKDFKHNAFQLCKTPIWAYFTIVTGPRLPLLTSCISMPGIVYAAVRTKGKDVHQGSSLRKCTKDHYCKTKTKKQLEMIFRFGGERVWC